MAQLTILNSMAGQDFETAIAQHKEWGLEWTDLRDAIYGKWVKDVTLDESTKAARVLEEQGVGVWCLSTSTFFTDIAKGEDEFTEHLDRLGNILAAAKPLNPQIVRIIAAQLPELEPGTDSVGYIKDKYPWMIDYYRRAIDLIVAAGYRPTIENEAFRCFMSTANDFHDFFDWLDHDKIMLTWDVQNQWATGVYPDLAMYENLKELIGYYHVKGGQFEDETSRALKWNVALDEAHWPVAEITQQVVKDEKSPVICINPTQHGENKDDYNYATVVERDIAFLRASVEGVE